MRKTIGLCLSLLFVLPISVFAETNSFIQSETVVDEEEKIYCAATIEDDFEEGVVLVTLKKSAAKINSLSDATLFSSCVKSSEISEVTELARITNGVSQEEIDKGNYKQILEVHIPEQGKEAVLSTIKKLEKHEDVLSAQPNYIYKMETEDVSFAQEESKQTTSRLDASDSNPLSELSFLEEQLGLLSA